jgi:hypothetical protein
MVFVAAATDGMGDSSQDAAHALVLAEERHALGSSQTTLRGCPLTDQLNPQFDRYRLILISRSTRLVFAETSNHVSRLPHVSILRWSRFAEQIQANIEDRWGLKAVILDCLGECSGTDNIVLAEVISEDRLDVWPHRFSWTMFSNVSDDEISGPDRSTIQMLLAMGNSGRGPFSRMGWTEELLDWIGAETSIDRSLFSGEIRQLNASATHSLVRLGGERVSRLWFKAVAVRDDREFQLTTLLSRLFPTHLPPLVAARRDWNGWLMEDAGRPLEEIGSIRQHHLDQVGDSLAELQLASVEKVDELIANGVQDQRMPVLRTGTPGLLPYFEEAMRAQSFDSVPRFSARRLREVEAILHDACFRLEELGIPYALVHNDINLGNILIGSDGCRFTDWASAGVSNPIVTLEQLKMQLVQDKRTVPWISRISEAYRKRWREVILDDAIDQALALVPLIAIATQMWSRKEWVLSEQRHNPAVQSYLRSLMRHMSRAAESPTILRALSA